MTPDPISLKKSVFIREICGWKSRTSRHLLFHQWKIACRLKILDGIESSELVGGTNELQDLFRVLQRQRQSHSAIEKPPGEKGHVKQSQEHQLPKRLNEKKAEIMVRNARCECPQPFVEGAESSPLFFCM